MHPKKAQKKKKKKKNSPHPKKGPKRQTRLRRDGGADQTKTSTSVIKDVVLDLVPNSPTPKASGESSRDGGGIPPSPFGDLFDLEAFIKANFMLEGNFERFESWLSHASFAEELVESHRDALKKTKAACEDRLRVLKKVYAQDHLDLEKKLRDSEKDVRNFTKGRNSLKVALAMAEDDAAGFEEEVVELEESNAARKDAWVRNMRRGLPLPWSKLRFCSLVSTRIFLPRLIS
jgi:hypothetical protein